MPPAVRIGDVSACPKVEPGAGPHGVGLVSQGGIGVQVNGVPIARAGDLVICPQSTGMIVSGSPTVKICGQPAARAGDQTDHGAILTSGSPDLMIS